MNRTIVTASAAVLVALTVTRAVAGKSEEKFDPDSTYVATSGPYRLTTQTATIRVGLVQPAALAGMPVGTTSRCSGNVDLRILDATNPTGPAIAESTGNALAPGTPAALEYAPSAGGDRTVFLVIVARGMNVDSKSCVLRGTKHVDVDKEVWRQDFGQLKADRHTEVATQ